MEPSTPKQTSHPTHVSLVGKDVAVQVMLGRRARDSPSHSDAGVDRDKRPCVDPTAYWNQTSALNRKVAR
jgi:hypothetical protein